MRCSQCSFIYCLCAIGLQLRLLIFLYIDFDEILRIESPWDKQDSNFWSDPVSNPIPDTD